MKTLEIETPHGPARAHLHPAAEPRAALVMGHGAGGACRTASELGAKAMLCLAFPLQPPQRKGKPRSPDRLEELDGVTVPTLVVQGESDQFGIPPEGPKRTVVLVPGTHTLRKMEPIAEAVRE